MSIINNVVNRMSAWAHYLSQDPADEDALRLAGDVVKLLDVVRTSNEYLLFIDKLVEDTVIGGERRDQLIAALKAVAEHRVEILTPTGFRPDSPGGIII